MMRIFDFNLEVRERFATVASIRALKSSGEKMVEVTATCADDAAAAEAAGIEMVVSDPANIRAVREGSSRLFVTSAIDFVANPPLTETEVLRASVSALQDGADAVHTCRRPQTVRRLTEEGIPVMCHVGFVPRQSSQIGGIRGVGKTAEEAMKIWDEIRQLEDAGAFAVECELIAAPMMAVISQRTTMATISLGSGSDADIIGLFTSDICGEGEHIPRHARVYADMNSLYEKIRAEKRRALAAFCADVRSGQYPAEAEIVDTDASEAQRFLELVDG